VRALRLKDLGRWYSGGTPPRDRPEHWDGDVPWLSAKDIDSTRLRPPTTFITREAALEHSRVVPRGALLLIVRGMALAHGLPVVKTDTAVAFNQDLRALVCAPCIEPRFVYYALIGHRWRLNAHVDQAAHGTARVVDSIYGERIEVPDQGGQRAVASFLGRECARIEMLSEELAATSALAATANADGLRRLIFGTGAPQVPLKFYAKTGTGHTPSREHPEYWAPSECVVPWFTLADIHQIRDGRRVEVDETSERVSETGLANSSAVKLPAGTVILSRTASVGFSAIMRVDMAVSQDFMTWTSGPRLDPRYLLLTLRAMQPELRGLMYGSTHKTIYMPDLHALCVPLPDVELQLDIVDRASRIAASTWPLVDEIATTQKALAEYREALITEAVSGQIDVTRLSDAHMEESLDAVREGERPEMLAS